MPFPTHRLRRLRATEPLRSLVRETHLHPGKFILPLFVCPGEGIRREIGSMPGNYQMSIDEMVKECVEVQALGIGGVILFGLPETKDDMASGAYDENGIVQRALRAIRREVPDLLLITDVCNCEYTSHGHCGYIKDGDVDNDTTLQWLAKAALSHARAGADIVAPSDMMDGRVWAIRQALDANGYEKIPILAYAAKFASVFYGPFREAADSAPQFGDRRSYQMDPANGREAMREIELDLQEGADMIMVKPAHALPRPDRPGARPLRRPHRRLSGERRILHDHGRRAKRLARSRPRHDRNPNLHHARRRRNHPDLLRQARRQVIGVAKGVAHALRSEPRP